MTSLLAYFQNVVAAAVSAAGRSPRRAPLQFTLRKFSRHGAARVDFPEDSLLRYECHDRLANERARSRRIQRQRRFASAAISRAPGAEARSATREALLRRDLHQSNQVARSRSISLHPQQLLLFAKCSGGCCGQAFSPDQE